MDTPLLQVKNLHIRFGDHSHPIHAVDGIDFSICRGETFVLLGESGSGKSVTALSIMRLLSPSAKVTQGSVLLNGQDLFTLPEYSMRNIRGGRIGIIFQEPQTSLNPVLTVGYQIGETLRHHSGLRGNAQRKRGIELLESVGIPESVRRYDEYPHQFSGGMKQRVMIAIALAGEPELLIADEPTTALDVTTQAQVLELLQQLQRDTNMGMLFITHDLAIANQIADHVAVMRYGKLVEQNKKAKLFASPQHAYTKELFAALPTRKTDDLETNIAPLPLLNVKDLKIYYPIQKGILKRTVDYVRAVDGISISVNQAQTVAIVGESGSGKTTTGKGILQLVRPTEGSVMFNNQDLTQISSKQLRSLRSDIQIIFQDPYSSMNPRMMVGDIVAEGMVAQNIAKTKKERYLRVDELLECVGLEAAHKYRYPHEFSGGQRQRICIARALAVSPKLIICDEPTSALDVSVQAQILSLLKDLQQRMQLAYLLITHNIGIVECLAHRVAVMYEGKIVEQGCVEEVMYKPQHPYTKELLAAVPRIKAP